MFKLIIYKNICALPCQKLFSNKILLQLLNSQLDALDKVLDSLEEKNDVIHAQLKDLLEDSKRVTIALQTHNIKHETLAWESRVHRIATLLLST